MAGKPITLTDKEIEGLAYYFAFWWAVLALAPRNNQTIRSMFVQFGFVKPKGKLALTASGERLIAFCKEDARPKHTAKPRTKR